MDNDIERGVDYILKHQISTGGVIWVTGFMKL
jgi:hypothetical protein